MKPCDASKPTKFGGAEAEALAMALEGQAMCCVYMGEHG